MLYAVHIYTIHPHCYKPVPEMSQFCNLPMAILDPDLQLATRHFRINGWSSSPKHREGRTPALPGTCTRGKCAPHSVRRRGRRREHKACFRGSLPTGNWRLPPRRMVLDTCNLFNQLSADCTIRMVYGRYEDVIARWISLNTMSERAANADTATCIRTR